MSFEIKKIHDPKFFKENCMAAHSDHVAYANETEAEEKAIDRFIDAQNINCNMCDEGTINSIEEIF